MDLDLVVGKNFVTMPELSTVFLSFITFVLTCVFLKWTNLVKIKKLPKGPLGLPLIGHLHIIGNNPIARFIEWKKRYGNVFCVRIGSWNAVVVNGYDTVKVTAENMRSAMLGRPNFVSNQILMKSTLNSCEKRYDTELALSLLTSNKSNHIEELVAHEASIFAEGLVKKCKIFPDFIQSDVQVLAARIICKLLYGHEKHTDIGRLLKVIIDTSQNINVYNSSLVDFIPWLRHIRRDKVGLLRQSVAQVNSVIVEQIDCHRKSFSAANVGDLTDALLATMKDRAHKADNSCSTDQKCIQQTLVELQQTGFDTIEKTLSWLILYMTKYPDVQERVHTEIDDLIGRRRRIELKDKPGLVYTNAVILEVMRIASVNPFSYPYCTVKDTKIGGFDIERDTIVLLNLYSIHHDKEFWDDPERFCPKRFIIEDHILDTHKINHVVPFGLGRRRCISEHLAKICIFIAFATVMQKCRFACPSDQTVDLEPVFGFMFSPKNYKVIAQEIF